MNGKKAKALRKIAKKIFGEGESMTQNKYVNKKIRKYNRRLVDSSLSNLTK